MNIVNDGTMMAKMVKSLWKLGRKRLAKFAANPRTVPAKIKMKM